MRNRSRSMLQEAVKKRRRLLPRLKGMDRVVQEVWVAIDQASGLEPSARIELIEEDDLGMRPRIIRVDRDDSP